MKINILYALATVWLSTIGPLGAETENTMKYVVNRDGQKPQTEVAIEGFCAWPNLTKLPDGTIVALIYNQPSHGRMPGDVECWASEDEGQTWVKRSVAAPRGKPEENRMNVAAGLTPDGDLMLATSGWSSPGDPDAWADIGQVLPTWICISKDGGVTWEIDRESFPVGPDGRHLIPYGDIMVGQDGKLRIASYRGAARDDETVPSTDSELAERAKGGQNWVVRGDGESWEDPVPLGEPSSLPHDFTETALCHLGDGEWLASARYGSGSMFMFSSTDDGETWSKIKGIKKIRGYPGHFLTLPDGTLVLTYGKRGGENQGVEVIFSHDRGQTWSDPYRILDTQPENGDIGYPSSVLLDDGQILTAYYEGNSSKKTYFMGVAVWDPDKTREAK